MDYEIRKCCIEDACSIQRLNAKELGYEYSIENTTRQLSRILARNTDLILVAVVNHDVIGYIHGCDYDNIGAPHMKNIMSIAVFEEYRRNGVGRALVSAIESWAKDTGAAGVRLVSGISRTQAHMFYRNCGYDCTKQQFNFKKWL